MITKAKASDSGPLFVPVRSPLRRQRHSPLQSDHNYSQPGKRPVLKTLSLSEAKMKLSELVESVRSTDEEVVITGMDGRRRSLSARTSLIAGKKRWR